MKHLYKIILLLTVITLLSSCLPQPKPSFYFPVMNLSVERYFKNDIQDTKVAQDHYYHKRAKELLKSSGYFRHFASKSSYKMEIHYKQFNHTSLVEVFGKALNPVNVIFGINLDCSVEMRVNIRQHGRVVESYHYEHYFKSKLEAISSKTKQYYDDFIERLIEDMLTKSKVKHIAH